MTGLSKEDWLLLTQELSDDFGYLERLGDHHFATFVEEGQSLLVTFETLSGIQDRNEGARPIGWRPFQSQGWSSLTLISDGETWFRDPTVYGYFDRLVDDGFFEDFEQVVFYGADSCGYAASAFSVAAPGATVVAVQPQATLAPDVTSWETRFQKQRKLSFTDRYGFAPDMIEAAEKAFVVFDPEQTLDAMHAALFSRPNVQQLTTRWLGTDVHNDFQNMQLLYPLLTHAMEGTLSRATFSEMWRTRRTYPLYLRRLMAALDQRNRPELTRMLCKNVISRMKGPRFARRLKELNAAKG